MTGAKGKHTTEPLSAASMTGWYDPGQLARTGVNVIVSAFFGERADFRALEALGPPQEAFKVEPDADDVWIDYLADTGDGFASTYAVAQLVARDELVVIADGKERTLPRGRALVMGGDEVYPTPSADSYADQLVMPFASAFPGDEDAARAHAAAGHSDTRPQLFAIPGNHDWYDGLGAFMNLFASGKSIGGWRTPQHRSYFALQLPHKTWLLGVDIQLDSDIDNSQIDYFDKLVQRGDRVILCTPEPDWVYRSSDVNGRRLYPKHDDPKHLDRLRELIAKKGAHLVLQLSGDLHHYRRQSSGSTHYVTAGGGGAFTHPTHTNVPEHYEADGRVFRCVTAFPSIEASRGLAKRNLIFPWNNPKFGVTTAVAYLILGLVMPMPSDPETGSIFFRAGAVALGALGGLTASPGSLAWVLAILGGFFAFTDTSKRWYRWVGGLGHGAAHLAFALLGGTLALHLRYVVESSTYDFVRSLFAANQHLWSSAEIAQIVGFAVYAVVLALYGYLVGAGLFGFYLWVSIVVAKRHSNEAYSAIKFEGFKNFLRLHITKDKIEVFAIGLEKVPDAKTYRRVGDGWSKSKDLKPQLIDRFAASVARDDRRSVATDVESVHEALGINAG
jgi:hypothetical protein